MFLNGFHKADSQIELLCHYHWVRCSYFIHRLYAVYENTIYNRNIFEYLSRCSVAFTKFVRFYLSEHKIFVEYKVGGLRVGCTENKKWWVCEWECKIAPPLGVFSKFHDIHPTRLTVNELDTNVHRHLQIHANPKNHFAQARNLNILHDPEVLAKLSHFVSVEGPQKRLGWISDNSWLTLKCPNWQDRARVAPRWIKTKNIPWKNL